MLEFTAPIVDILGVSAPIVAILEFRAPIAQIYRIYNYPNSLVDKLSLYPPILL
jgi:hypothetical protein